jgi:uncharacterized protein (DUF2384 family)
MPSTNVALKAASHNRQCKVLTSATLNAAQLLDISQVMLAKILGVSPPTISRMRGGNYHLDQKRKEWDLAVLFVRLFRSLDSMTAGREADAKAWLHSANRGFGNKRPVDLIESVTGLVHAVDYLDAVRGRI